MKPVEPAPAPKEKYEKTMSEKALNEDTVPHMKNFFDAIRGKASLHSPGDVAYGTAVMVLKVNEAVAARRMLEFAPSDFAA